MPKPCWMLPPPSLVSLREWQAAAAADSNALVEQPLAASGLLGVWAIVGSRIPLLPPRTPAATPLPCTLQMGGGGR
jgi:hypothetical protein